MFDKVQAHHGRALRILIDAQRERNYKRDLEKQKKKKLQSSKEKTLQLLNELK